MTGAFLSATLNPSAELEPAHSDAETVAPALCLAQSWACSLDEQRAQVAILALADPEQHFPITAGALDAM